MTRRINPAADARVRGWRTMFQGLAFAALTAVVFVLLPVFSSATSWDDLDWRLIGFALVQAVGTSILSWVQRTYLDGHNDPTPLTDDA